MCPSEVSRSGLMGPVMLNGSWAHAEGTPLDCYKWNLLVPSSKGILYHLLNTRDLFCFSLPPHHQNKLYLNLQSMIVLVGKPCIISVKPNREDDLFHSLIANKQKGLDLFNEPWWDTRTASFHLCLSASAQTQHWIDGKNVWQQLLLWELLWKETQNIHLTPSLTTVS